VAEGARLESVFRGNSNVGSNPTLSAIMNCPHTTKAVILSINRKALSRRKRTRDCGEQFVRAMGLETVA
jgi:hypothetical protein